MDTTLVVGTDRIDKATEGVTMPARPMNPMPDDVQQRLVEAALMDDYDARPRYQRNDYLGWIGRARQPATREKRIAQMLDELQLGGVYMGMQHTPSRKDASKPRASG